MSVQEAPRLVRRLPWAEADLVEGTEALLWPASGTEDGAGEAPDPAGAYRAVLSWVRPQILRFETLSPEPLPELLLVSTLSVAGPAQFVVRKTYQIGATAACEPPSAIHIVERRDLFRVPVATPATVTCPAGSWSLFSMDCSLGGLRVCPPKGLEVGTEVQVKLELHQGVVVTVPASVRHSHPYMPGRIGPVPTTNDCDGCPSIVGLQFAALQSEPERRLSEFVSRHQRRLMPRVQRRLPVEYCPEERPYFLETFASDISPGDIDFESRKPHVPGEKMKIRLRLGGRQEFEFSGVVVSCHSSCDDDGRPLHTVKVSFRESGDANEARFRKAVREVAIDKLVSQR